MKFLEPYTRDTPGWILLRYVVASLSTLAVGHYLARPDVVWGMIGVFTVLTVIKFVVWRVQRSKKPLDRNGQPPSGRTPTKPNLSSASPTLPTDAAFLAEARQNPDGWVFVMDGVSDPNGAVPPERITGAWKVDANGKPTGEYKANQNYRPHRA